jgi:uncharacterized membrane protein YbhN (UPF0104 family)
VSEPAPEARRGSGRGRLLGLFKVVFALALLGWVAKGLPWRDSLEWSAGGVTRSAPGDLLGDWHADEVRFRFDPGVALEEGWPQELRTALAAAEATPALRHKDRSDAAAEGYSWQPGMPTVFAGLSLRGLLLAFFSMLGGVLFGVTRWWRLLRLARCPSSWWNTLRLTFLGLFFNLVFPGLTGGDVPKALLVVREHPDRRADALATVVIDRLIGLWALIGIAAVVCLTGGARFDPLKLPVAGTMALATGGMAFLLFPGPRRALGLDRLIDRLPLAEKLRKLERSALVYAEHRGELVLAILLSLGNHALVITQVYFLGDALGAALGYGDYFGFVPVASVVTSLPLSPGGWGVGEAAYGKLFELMGSSLAMGVAVSVTYRLCNVALSLVGGLCLLLPGARVTRQEVLELEQEAESLE